MEISSLLEGRDHGLAIGQMGQDSQFQLSVISHDEFLALLCHKGLPDLIDIFVQGWLVLDVGLSTGESACFCVDIDRTVDAPIAVHVAL